MSAVGQKFKLIFVVLLVTGQAGIILFQYQGSQCSGQYETKETQQDIQTALKTKETQQDIQTALKTNIRHNGTQKPMPVSLEVEKMLLHVAKRSLDESSRDAVRHAAVVTACNSGHYEEVKDGVASYQTQYPGQQIIIYDLGLTKDQQNDIKTWCNVEYRLFEFAKYPVHFRNLFLYGWKAFVVLEVLMEHDAVIWMDASIRMKSKYVIEQLALTAGNSGTVLPETLTTSMFCHTHPGMYDYIKTNQTLAKIATQHGGAFIVLVNTKDIFSGVIQWWVRCSYTKECIAPTGHSYYCSKISGCFDEYAGCHRYDQAAASLILLHHFQGDVGRFSAFVYFDLLRYPTHSFKLSKCKKSNATL